MRVVIVGSGNVATILGRLIKKSGHEVVQVISRDKEHARALAAELQCSFIDYAGPVDRGAEFYLFAINDSALYELSNAFHLDKAMVVHTAGSIPKDVLQHISVNYGVLYPLQSLRKEMETARDIPMLVDGNTPEAITLIADFARTISDTVSVAGDEERLKLHVAAVIVSNFTNHLYALAEDFCEKEKVDFNMLVPLIRETANRIATHSPAAVQTGPAVRNDIYTLDKHLRLLANYPKLKYVYLKLTESIMNK